MIRLDVLILAVAFCVQRCCAQSSGWQTDQVDTTMCQWQSPRVGVVRDTVYIDGGALWWKPGFADGSFGSGTNDGNPMGLVYTLNFSLPFKTTPDFNQSALFANISKVPNGGLANNIGPNYLDGTMLANDYGWWTYGGLLDATSVYSLPLGNSFTQNAIYSSSPFAKSSGFILGTLPSDVTRYVTYGAGVSVPSENLGFYFGGLKSKSGGPIYYPATNSSVNFDHLSTTLIGVNMTLIPPGQSTWNKKSLPSSIPGRASGELAWVPVSTQGILVGIGGVTNLVYSSLTQSQNDTVAANTQAQSAAFMQFVSVYNIAKNVWYQQRTTGPQPPVLAQGCTVVASAEDGSSHNIYWYGGFDGSHQAGTFNDAVWVLSIPSFTWVKLSEGVASHARAGHRCVKPYPDQMFVIGGYSPLVGNNNIHCVEGGIIQVFNLTSGKWLDSYDPDVHSPYRVPDAVVSKIGGNGAGSATLTAPPSGFATSGMKALFAAPYNTSKITNWYPYKKAVETSSAPSSTVEQPNNNNKSGTPKYLAPVLAVILGLFFITLVILGILLWRRRKLLKTNGGATQSESGTMDIRFRVSNWLRGTPNEAKSPTVTTEDPITAGYKYDFLHNQMPEAGGTQVHEMMDTSSPAELRGTGLRDTTLTETILSETGLVAISQTPLHELASQSELSSQRPVSTGTLPRSDSPSVIGSNADVTSIASDFEPGHGRGLSDATVSADGDHVASAEGGAQSSTAEAQTATPQGQRAGAVSPMTPTEIAASSSGGDYLSKGKEPAQEVQEVQAAIARPSNFSEDLDEKKDTK